MIWNNVVSPSDGRPKLLVNAMLHNASLRYISEEEQMRQALLFATSFVVSAGRPHAFFSAEKSYIKLCYYAYGRLISFELSLLSYCTF